MLRIIKENRRLRKENAELRKVIEEALRELRKENTELRKTIKEALQDLQDPECPPGVRILSTSIRLERALEKDSEELQLNRIPKKVIVYHSLIVRQNERKSNENQQRLL